MAGLLLFRSVNHPACHSPLVSRVSSSACAKTDKGLHRRSSSAYGGESGVAEDDGRAYKRLKCSNSSGQSMMPGQPHQ